MNHQRLEPLVGSCCSTAGRWIDQRRLPARETRQHRSIDGDNDDDDDDDHDDDVEKSSFVLFYVRIMHFVWHGARHKQAIILSIYRIMVERSSIYSIYLSTGTGRS
jgi:hypothetical protein